MNKKYYTPSPEEFHLGFEFENETWSYDISVVDDIKTIMDNREKYRENPPEGVEYLGWIPMKWDEKCSAETVFRVEKDKEGNTTYHVPENIRVKHLDKESIEAEGFEYDEQYKDFVEKKHHTAVFHKTAKYRGEDKQLMLIYNKASHWVLLSFSNGDPSYAVEKNLIGMRKTN